MKSYSDLYDLCISERNRKQAIHDAMKSKRIKKLLKQRHMSPEDALAQSYQWVLNYPEVKHKPILIYDGITHKERTIIVPTLEELVVQHTVVNVLKPIIMRGMYEHSYASIPKRGIHKGKKTIEKWIRHDPKNCRYVLKLDIHHFFDSISHDVIETLLRTYIRDDQLLALIFRILDTTSSGLPLGFYTSQWLANWLLQSLDHFIKECLHATHYIRYMDDIVI
jgi:RNA-directed DNA polymerase